MGGWWYDLAVLRRGIQAGPVQGAAREMVEDEVADCAQTRVLYVGDFSASRVGNHSVAEDLAVRMAESGLDVATTSEQRRRGFRVGDMLVSTLRLRGRVDVGIVDVFSGRAFLWAEAVAGLLRGRGVPYVLVLHGGGLPSFASRAPRRVARLLRSAARVVAPSDYLAQQMAPYMQRCEVIPNPIDIGGYEFRRRMHARPRLIWLRTFEGTYNPFLAVRVLARLVPDLPDVTLTMIGGGAGSATFARTRQLAEELGVLDRVDFPGPVAKRDVPQRLQTGDILLNTPRVDNVPVSVLEAMACGLCIVSTAVGGIPYLLRDGDDALLVPGDDSGAMADAVMRCVSDPALSAKLSLGGRRRAEAFDWGTVLPRWMELVGEIVEGETE